VALPHSAISLSEIPDLAASALATSGFAAVGSGLVAGESSLPARAGPDASSVGPTIAKAPAIPIPANMSRRERIAASSFPERLPVFFRLIDSMISLYGSGTPFH
jgi:hypothetical protein